jgi:cell division protein FtsL
MEHRPAETLNSTVIKQLNQVSCKLSYIYKDFFILTAVKMLMLVFSVVTLKSAALKIEAVCPSVTLVSTCKPTRRYNPNSHLS